MELPNAYAAHNIVVNTANRLIGKVDFGIGPLFTNVFR
jgi:hypothetical protein